MKTIPPIILAFIFILTTLNAGCSSMTASSSSKTPLVVYAAGSLIVPFSDLAKAFESKYPQIDVQAQYHGSIQVIRQVTDLHIPIDVVATADASLLPMLMYTTNDPDSGLPMQAGTSALPATGWQSHTSHPAYMQTKLPPTTGILYLADRTFKLGLADPRVSTRWAIEH